MMDLSFYNNGHKEVFYEKGLMERPYVGNDKRT